MSQTGLDGPRFEIDIRSQEYPELLKEIADPPQKLYGIGDSSALQPGVGIIGARKATPYGLSCAEYFASHAALRGLTVISGGARGCDQEAHRAAVEAEMPTVVVFGSGADVIYPKSGAPLFRKIIAGGGVVISENPWGFQPLPYCFPRRNRIIAGLSALLLIVEAGLPSGTLTTADEALSQGKDVAIVPGAITSPYAKGVNWLFRQGAVPVVDYESFDDALESAYLNCPIAMVQHESAGEEPLEAMRRSIDGDPLLRTLAAQAYSAQELTSYFGYSAAELSRRLSEYEMSGVVERGRDGRYQVKIS